jgi:hypothetical protein
MNNREITPEESYKIVFNKMKQIYFTLKEINPEHILLSLVDFIEGGEECTFSEDYRGRFFDYYFITEKEIFVAKRRGIEDYLKAMNSAIENEKK